MKIRNCEHHALTDFWHFFMLLPKLFGIFLKNKIFSFNMTDKILPKSAKKRRCDSCDYLCSKLSDWERHLLTRKHQNTDKILTQPRETRHENNHTIYECDCGKIYKHRQSLFNHRKKCVPTVSTFSTELIDKLTSQNATLMEQNTKLFEMITQTNNTLIQNQHSCSINSCNINNNNKFSINVFLNETCKDAINLTDFVNEIQLTINDLEETSMLGYVDGISKVFINNLKNIDYTKRPIHCSDSKRDVLYIKDDNKWVKENDTKMKLTDAIKKVANKNLKQIPEWQKKNPDYLDPNSKKNDKYMKMICEVMSGSSKEEQDKNYNKIIKNISREVIIRGTQ